MRKKIILIISLIILIGFIGYLVVINVFFNDDSTTTANNEYVPEVEISDDELRTTIVTLYFVDTRKPEVLQVRQDLWIQKSCY